jgi:hypothetical protein
MMGSLPSWLPSYRNPCHCRRGPGCPSRLSRPEGAVDSGGQGAYTSTHRCHPLRPGRDSRDEGRRDTGRQARLVSLAPEATLIPATAVHDGRVCTAQRCRSRWDGDRRPGRSKRRGAGAGKRRRRRPGRHRSPHRDLVRFAPGGKVDVGVVEGIWSGINQESA